MPGAAAPPFVSVAWKDCVVFVTSGPAKPGVRMRDGPGRTVMITSSAEPNNESFALSRKTYEPGFVNETEVASDVGLVKLATPGPLTCVHANVSWPPTGLPSSVT